MLRTVAAADKQALDAFISELKDNRFLNNIRTDCLEIYPRILAAEISLRPALFLDFDACYTKEVTSFRVSSDDFQTHKDLYKDISEILSRQLIVVAGLNNLIHRGNHNVFNADISNPPSSLQKYADLSFGLKLQFLDNCWYSLQTDAADNQLRNAIAHYRAEYEEVTQTITYYPKKEGMRQDRAQSMTFLDFMRKILISYRELHRLHQLIKCLHYYLYFLHSERKQS